MMYGLVLYMLVDEHGDDGFEFRIIFWSLMLFVFLFSFGAKFII